MKKQKWWKLTITENRKITIGKMEAVHKTNNFAHLMDIALESWDKLEALKDKFPFFNMDKVKEKRK